MLWRVNISSECEAKASFGTPEKVMFPCIFFRVFRGKTSFLMNQNQKKLLIGGVMIALGVAYLIYAGLQGASVYYVTVEEFLSTQDQPQQVGTRIAGTVAAGSIRRSANAREVYFELQSNTSAAKMPVYYKGSIPDIFREHAAVVVEGKFQPEHQRFYAATLMTSCPSKYESKVKSAP